MSRLPLPTEEEVVTKLRRDEVTFPPLRLTWEESKSQGARGVVRLTDCH